jgi:hypothetical protein
LLDEAARGCDARSLGARGRAKLAHRGQTHELPLRGASS